MESVDCRWTEDVMAPGRALARRGATHTMAVRLLELIMLTGSSASFVQMSPPGNCRYPGTADTAANYGTASSSSANPSDWDPVNYDYVLDTSLTCAQCESACADDSQCLAYECRTTQGWCEIWNKVPAATGGTSGLCYLKELPSPDPPAAPSPTEPPPPPPKDPPPPPLELASSQAAALVVEPGGDVRVGHLGVLRVGR